MSHNFREKNPECKNRFQAAVFRYLFLAMMAGCSLPATAQLSALKEKVTVTQSQTTALSLIEAIDRQSSYSFTYAREQLSVIAIPVFKAEGMDLGEALLLLQKNYGLQFAVRDRNISVRPGPKPETKPVAIPSRSRGKIAGKIIDEETGDPVPGATIHIGDQATATDTEGGFTLLLPQGSYTAMISYIGYGTKEIGGVDIITGHQIFELNVTLRRETGSLAGVVVKSSVKKESVAALYSRRKNAAGITDGISAEQIARTPDKNIGESLKRISGVSTVDNKYVVVRGLSERYNQALLNGQAMPSTELNRKQFSFDIIPSNMVDNITVSKTITPDKSAEFGGGLVEINTKDIPAENFLTLTTGISVNSLTAGQEQLSLKRDGNGYRGDYADHRNLFGRKNWHSLSAIRAYQEAHADETILSNNWEPYYYKAMPSQNYQLSFGRVKALSTDKQRRLGFIAAASYRNTQSIQQLVSERFGFENGSLTDHGAGLLRGNQYGFTTNIGAVAGAGYDAPKAKISWQNFFTRLLDEQVNFGKGTHHNSGENSYALAEKVQRTSLWQSRLKGQHDIGRKGIQLNWLGNYTYVERERPDNHILIWSAPTNAFSFPYNEFNIVSAVSEGISEGYLRLFSKAVEKNIGWEGSVLLPFRIGKTKNSFKTGYAGWYKDRSFYVALIGDKPLPRNNLLPVGDFFEGGKSIVSRFGDDYNRAALLHAVYGMFDNQLFKKLRIVWGLRAEYFDINSTNQALDRIVGEINSSRPNNDKLDFSALYSREKNWNLFPSVNLSFSITPKMNLRLAYAKSIIRPDLREMSVFREYDFELGGEYISDLLRSTRFNNYDLRLEWYPSAGEVLSASLFYKDVKYPMEIFKYQSQNVYTLKNNYKSHNYGVELEMRKSLDFTGVRFIRNLTLYGNFTALASKVTPMEEEINRVNGNVVVPEVKTGKEEKRPLMGQSNYTGNAGLYYDDKLLHISLSYNAMSGRMMIFEQDAIGSQYEKPLRSLDAQIACRFLNQRAEARFNIGNILNEEIVTYRNFGTEAEMTEAKKGHYSTRFLFYDADKDMLTQKLTPGITYGLTISYFIR
ncbi:MAG: TonB-dependent receptor [Chitinophagaceae bacterium]